MFLSILSNSKVYPIEDELLDALLDFMITLLEGGNQRVQKTVFNYFSYFPISEILFEKFYRIFTNAINSENLESKSNFSLLDDEESGELVEKNKLESKILMKILTLLQLFTEGSSFNLKFKFTYFFFI